MTRIVSVDSLNSDLCEVFTVGEQIKSRKRVQNHGEVFTNPREVNAMLDMVKQETERIESRFLEPACGTGNFLIEVLRRKLAVVKARYYKSATEYERYSFLAVSSIYGVELLEDNARECRARLLELVMGEAKSVLKNRLEPEFQDPIAFVLERNILCGDALTLKADDGEPIIFSEWSLVTGDKVKRRDFRLDELLEDSTRNDGQMLLFGASGTPTSEWEFDEELQTLLPKPIKEYPLCDWREVRARD